MCGGSIGASSSSRGYVRGCGMVFIVLGMTFFYSFGYYGFSIAAPLLVIGLCLTVGGSIGGGEARTYSTPIRTTSAPKRETTPPPSEIPLNHEDALMRAARHAQELGLLEQRQDPYDSTLVIPVYRCQSCGRESDFQDVELRGNGIVWTFCRHRVAF